jgi:hypothetical protein
VVSELGSESAVLFFECVLVGMVSLFRASSNPLHGTKRGRCHHMPGRVALACRVPSPLALSRWFAHVVAHRRSELSGASRRMHLSVVRRRV